MKQNKRGFTLIEIMVTVAILGILATIGAVSYMHYIQRAKYLEVSQSTRPYTIAVASCAQLTGSLTQCAQGENGVPTPPQTDLPKYISSISVAEDGTVTAISKNIADGNYSYILQPTLSTSGSVSWQLSDDSSCLAKNLCSKVTG